MAAGLTPFFSTHTSAAKPGTRTSIAGGGSPVRGSNGSSGTLSVSQCFRNSTRTARIRSASLAVAALSPSTAAALGSSSRVTGSVTMTSFSFRGRSEPSSAACCATRCRAAAAPGGAPGATAARTARTRAMLHARFSFRAAVKCEAQVPSRVRAPPASTKPAARRYSDVNRWASAVGGSRRSTRTSSRRRRSVQPGAAVRTATSMSRTRGAVGEHRVWGLEKSGNRSKEAFVNSR